MNQKYSFLTHKKATLTLFLVGLILASWANTLPLAHAIGEGWLDGWDYRKSIEITENNGEVLTNYQIKFDVNYGAGVDSGYSVYTDSNCSTDFSDIRFTDDDGSTLLDYWIEEYTTGGDASIWVEVPTIPDSLTADIYIYYGNVGASDASDGYLTFPIFDDFDGSSINATIWTETLGGWTRSVSDSQLHLTRDSATTQYRLHSNIALDVPDTRKKTIMNFTINTLTSGSDVQSLRVILADRDAVSAIQGMRWYREGAFDRYIQKQNGNTFWAGANKGAVTGTTRLEYQFNPVGDTFRAIATGARTFNDLRTDAGDWDTYTTYIQLLFGNYPANPDYDVSYVFIAEFVPSEPTITAWGSVEFAPSLEIDSIDGVNCTDLEWVYLNVTVSAPNITDWEYVDVIINQSSLDIGFYYVNGSGFGTLKNTYNYISFDVSSSLKTDIDSNTVNVSFYIMHNLNITQAGWMDVDSFANTSTLTDTFNSTDTYYLTIRNPPIPYGLFGCGMNGSVLTFPHVDLGWVTNDTIYEYTQVWRSDDGNNYFLVANISSSLWRDDNVTQGEDYYYKVRNVRLTGIGMLYSVNTSINYEKVFWTSPDAGYFDIWVPSSILTTVGTVNAGNLYSVQVYDDNDYYDVQEVVGMPAMLIYYNFTDIPNNVVLKSCNINASYEGNPIHIVMIEFYCASHEDWRDIGFIPDNGGFSWYNNSIACPIANIWQADNNGTVSMRLHHYTSGNPTHQLLIDYIEFRAFVPTVTTGDPLIRVAWFWIIIAFVLGWLVFGEKYK